MELCPEGTLESIIELSGGLQEGLTRRYTAQLLLGKSFICLSFLQRIIFLLFKQLVKSFTRTESSIVISNRPIFSSQMIVVALNWVILDQLSKLKHIQRCLVN